MPLALNRFSGWLDYPEYYFYWNFHGNNSIFNISSYQNKEMDALIDKARFTTDKGPVVTALAFGPDSKLLLLADTTGRVRILSAADGKMQKEWKTESAPARVVALVEEEGPRPAAS